MQKTFSSKKRCTIFYDNFFLTTRVMKNFFCLFFYSRIFACKKNVAKKSIRLTWLMNLFFVIKTVPHLSVTTFFECEMKISYKECISESENVEDSN